ncbi:serine hydrolase-like protein 2 isoform X2 [Phymastichus coffea]|uniref:serine hydrolase-like protein 2 isoform X2 n=1 Tax=Phymastichus coffea TaxID=108790 RepID=UPI00273ADE53|nr:serine hydrolase-like protein 2 isoform X2 [Phymastichus coffea]
MNSKIRGSLKLKVPWGYVDAKTWGNPQKTHILVVHGIMDNAGAFDRLIAQLPENFYYVCIDLPGHGLSSHFPSGLLLSYFSFVLTIRYVLDELKWDQTYYMGHSFGAHLGVLFSIIYPHRIQKLILIDGIIAVPYSNKDLINYIKDENNLVIEESKSNNPRLYTEEEVIYALSYLRNCCLNTEAAKALFERAATKGEIKKCIKQ